MLGSLLGLTDDDLKQLVDDRLIGSRPVGARRAQLKVAARLLQGSPMTDHSPMVTGESLSAWRPDAFKYESADAVGQPPRALTVPRAVVVISFDIDGTMEFGDPPGPVSASIARELVDRGCILGVASDWAMSCQGPEWARHGIAPRFVGGKHHLPAVKSRFTADRYVHVGDTAVDEHYARLAGFTFLHANQLPNPVSADAIHFA